MSFVGAEPDDLHEQFGKKRGEDDLPCSPALSVFLQQSVDCGFDLPLLPAHEVELVANPEVVGDGFVRHEKRAEIGVRRQLVRWEWEPLQIEHDVDKRHVLPVLV